MSGGSPTCPFFLGKCRKLEFDICLPVPLGTSGSDLSSSSRYCSYCYLVISGSSKCVGDRDFTDYSHSLCTEVGFRPKGDHVGDSFLRVLEFHDLTYLNLRLKKLGTYRKDIHVYKGL